MSKEYDLGKAEGRFNKVYKLLSLEALEKLRQNFKDDSHLFDYELFDIIETALKALEIIKEKRVNVHLLVLSDSLEKYNFKYNFNLLSYRKLTKEEYDLLKEVLL